MNKNKCYIGEYFEWKYFHVSSMKTLRHWLLTKIEKVLTCFTIKGNFSIKQNCCFKNKLLFAIFLTKLVLCNFTFLVMLTFQRLFYFIFLPC